MKKTSILVCAILSIVLFLPLVSASENSVGVYLLNLGKFDVATGSFTADFYLSLTCESNCSTDFEFINGRASSVDKIIDLPNEKFYRIQANLNSPVDLKRFPFDQQKMQIIMEDKKATTDQLIYVPIKEESGIDDSIVFPGWTLKGWDVESREHYYDVYDETYSQYVFTVDISRIYSNSFMKTFLPVLFLVIVVMFTFLMDLDKITQRLTLVSSSLIGAVMFHISISNQIPPVGYMTIADKFMILTYFFMLASIAITILLLELHEQKKTELVTKIHRKTEYGVFIVVPILYILFFLIFV